jgi:hypothetical protein
VTWKITVVPTGTEAFESLNFHSEAVTLIVTVLDAFERAAIAGYAKGAATPATQTQSSARMSQDRLKGDLRFGA